MISRSKGRLVTVEGIDGSGKTTLARHFLSWLERKHFSSLALKEPGSTWLGSWLYEKLLSGVEFSTLSPKAELALFLAARCETIDKKLLPALEQGKIVVVDRF